MNIETALIIGLIIVVVWLAYEYLRAYRKLLHRQKDTDRSVETAHKKATKILDEAHEQALKILKEARTGATAHREKINTKMDAALNAVADREIKDFKNALETETINIEKAVGQKIATRYDEVKQEVEDYKAKQITGVDQKINKVLLEIAQNLLGKTINARDHQELVIKALEEAKQNGLFD